MAKRLIDLDNALAKAVAEAAEVRGESEQAFIEEALRQHVSSEEPAEVTDPAEVNEILRRTAGLWQDRMDLPDLTSMRREWDERLERLFGNG